MINETLPGLILASILIGAGGAGHCVGMCGGISGALTFAVPEQRRTGLRLWGWQLLFGLGRLATYVLLGVTAGALGGELLDALPAPAMTVGLALAGVLMLFLALHLAGKGGLLMGLEQAGKSLWRRIQPVTRIFMPIDRIHKAWLLGMVWGLLPCGLVYAALALAATSGTATSGGLVMAAFGSVTVVPVVATGIVASRLTLLRGPRARKVSVAMALLLSGSFFLMAWWMSSSGHDHAHHHLDSPHHGHVAPSSLPDTHRH